MVEVANTQKYGDLQTKRSYWQHGSLGGVKTIILMTYQHEDVLDNHTCILEVWKTAHRHQQKIKSHSQYPEHFEIEVRLFSIMDCTLAGNILSKIVFISLRDF